MEVQPMSMPASSDVKPVGGIETISEIKTQQSSEEAASPQKTDANTTPVKVEKDAKASTPEQAPGTTLASVAAKANLSEHKPKFKERKLGPNGEKRNFYNPPGKVMRHLQQASYFDNFYGSQGQMYTLKQKFKTQLCRHWQEEGECPLRQYCQFAHGAEELRKSTDPLPKHFGQMALGAVHSNYKTEPCKYMEEGLECKFGDGCSFYHDEKERRSLIDPLPNLPEGVTLPPMPERQNSYRPKNKNHGGYQNYDQQFVPGYSLPPQPMIQLSSLADIVALGGFNPNKYLGPTPNNNYGAPQPFSSQFNSNFNGPPHLMTQSAPFHGQPNAGPQQFNPQGGQKKGNYKKGGNPDSPVKNGQRYEKKDKNAAAKKEKAQGEKKYSPKKQPSEAAKPE